ncbi:IS66 family insertion sequence element accessory protein TnpB [Caldibacillus thermoamylovorans]|nr:IS66 family insertion sequence element accessory protein TnpB [Caldibacillus thermoamylovorans]
MSKTELQKEWELRIADFRASGQTQSKWCADNHVKLHQLKYWLKKLEKTNQISIPSPKWVPITLDEQHAESKDTLQIYIGQASIEVKPGFDPSFLADVVRTLRSLC